MKITKYFLSMAAAIGMIAGCQKPEMVQISSPEDVVAPVLETFEGPIEITPSNLGLEDIVLTWSLADYGVPTQIDYSVEAAVAANPDTKVIITSGIVADDKEQEAGCISEKITYETLNAVLFNDLKLEDGVAADVNFTIGSKVGEYAKVYSNAVTVTCKVTASEKQYPKVWVIGDYCGWAHDKSQFLFDFAGDDAVYQGVVDFGEKAANGWKVTGVGKWDDTCNWGGDENVTYEAEAETTQLINGGGSKDLKHYSKRFYHFSFEKATLVLTKTIGFDHIGVVGSFNGWNQENNVEMSFNASKQKFYADVEFTEDGEFKFNLEKKWDIAFGLGEEGFLTTENASNITAKAGKYRIYLMMNNYGEITYELNPKMFGKDEPVGGTTPAPETPDTPEPVKGWSLIGAFNEWAGDLMLASDGTFYVLKGVELEGELKFRKDGQWNYKGEDGNDVQTNLGAAEGVTFAADEELALAPNGGNINVTAGTYDVYLDPENAKAWFITDGSYPGGGEAPEASIWGVVGDVNGWNAPDITMYKTSTEGLFVAYKTDMPAGGFKIRANGVWDDTANYGLASAGNVEVDHAYDVICGGGSGNMTIAAGTYDIWFDLNNSKVYIMTPGKPISEAEGGQADVPDPSKQTWYMVGNFNGWNPADEAYKMTAEGDFFVFKNFTAPAEVATDGGTEACQAKFAPGAWNGDKGGNGEFAVDAACATGSSNITVPAGTYDVYLAKDLSAYYFMTPGKTPADAGDVPEFEPVASEWGIVGDVNGWNAPDITMYTTPTEGLFVASDTEMPAGGFKIRANGVWNDAANYGLASAGNVEVDHAYDVICSGGSGNMTIAAGTYDIWFDLNNSKVYIMTPGKSISEAEGGQADVPDPSEQTWYMAGNFNNWSTNDEAHKMTLDGNFFTFKNFTAAEGCELKFAPGAWNGDKGGNGTFAVNTACPTGSSNIAVTAGTYDVYLAKDLSEYYFMEVGKTPGN